MTIQITKYESPNGKLKLEHYLLTADSDRYTWLDGKYATRGKGEVLIESHAGGWFWNEYNIHDLKALKRLAVWENIPKTNKGWKVTREYI